MTISAIPGYIRNLFNTIAVNDHNYKISPMGLSYEYTMQSSSQERR